MTVVEWGLASILASTILCITPWCNLYIALCTTPSHSLSHPSQPKLGAPLVKRAGRDLPDPLVIHLLPTSPALLVGVEHIQLQLQCKNGEVAAPWVYSEVARQLDHTMAQSRCWLNQSVDEGGNPCHWVFGFLFLSVTVFQASTPTAFFPTTSASQPREQQQDGCCHSQGPDAIGQAVRRRPDWHRGVRPYAVLERSSWRVAGLMYKQSFAGYCSRA